MAAVEDLKVGDIISYNSGSDDYTAIVMSIEDEALSLIDVSTTNKNYVTPQGYTYIDYEESLREGSIKNITVVGYISIIDYIRNQLPEYFL